jgi:hypothetical protein
MKNFKMKGWSLLRVVGIFLFHELLLQKEAQHNERYSASIPQVRVSN